MKKSHGFCLTPLISNVYSAEISSIQIQEHFRPRISQKMTIFEYDT